MIVVASLVINGRAAEWEDLSVNSINRLPPRTYAMPLESEQAALTDALEPETPYKKSLNGEWKFAWAGNPELRQKDFWHADFDDSTVTDQFEPYVRPQDNGYKCDVRWAEFTDAAGKGVRFSASEPLFMQALHYGFEDLEFARHRAGQKRYNTPLLPRAEVCLNLDVRQLGLGGASCGPKPMEKYIFPIEKTEWTLKITPVR